MTGTEISELIGALRVETARDSISPEHVGYLLELLNERIGTEASLSATERGELVSALSALEERVTAEEGATAELLEKVAQMEGYAKKGDVIADGSLTAQSTAAAVALELELTDGLGESLSRGVTLPTATETGAGVVTSAQVKQWNAGAAAAESAEAKVDGLRILPFNGFLETTDGVSGEADWVYFVKDVGRFMQQVDGEWTYEISRGGYNMIVSAMPELGIAESVSADPWKLFTWSGNLYRASGSELESVAWSGDLSDVEAGGVVRIDESTIDALLS